jgi:hypothetical protein
MADVNRVELSLESIPATIFVAEEFVDQYVAQGWTKVSHGRRRSNNPPTGSTPVQGR